MSSSSSSVSSSSSAGAVAPAGFGSFVTSAEAGDNPLVTSALTLDADHRMIVGVVHQQQAGTERTGGPPTWKGNTMTQVLDTKISDSSEGRTEMWYYANSTGTTGSMSVPNTPGLNMMAVVADYTHPSLSLSLSDATGATDVVVDPRLTLNSVAQGSIVIEVVTSGSKDLPSAILGPGVDISTTDHGNWSCWCQYATGASGVDITMGHTGVAEDDAPRIMAAFVPA